MEKNELEQDLITLKKELNELKNIEETWQKINSNQISYLLNLLDK